MRTEIRRNLFSFGTSLLGVLTLIACVEARRLSTEWPASDDDVVFIVQAYVLGPEEGLLVAPPGEQSGGPVEVGVISSDSECGVLTDCSGYNRFDEGFESARADFTQPMLFYTTDRCPILAGYVPETGCATEIAVEEVAGRLFADERWLTFTSGFKVFEIPASAFASP